MNVRVPYHGIGIGPQGIADERGFYRRFAHRDHPVTIGDFADFGFGRMWYRDGVALRGAAGRGERFVVDEDGRRRGSTAAGYQVAALRHNIGIFGVAAGSAVHVVDLYTLAEPVGSRLAVRPSGRARPGHAKDLPEVWALARYAAPQPADPVGVVDARAALRCGELRELVLATSAPMTPHRFAANLLAAPRLTVLRVPYDPTAALSTLCAPLPTRR